VVSAHSADFVWRAGGAIALYAQRGWRVKVVCLSFGERGESQKLLATSLISRGVCGLVIDIGCRDVAELTRMKFPVWSKAISAKGAIKATLGCVNIPVICAGAVVNPGDVVVADDDGVVIVPLDQASSVVSADDQRIAREAEKRRRLAAGELNLDIENMRAKLASAGLVYYESPDEARRNLTILDLKSRSSGAM
jgi:4-hydroxy-4-methyl-2-oxoglutarate aldolase